MQVKNYRTKRGYYLAHDTDEKVGGDFSFLILPLYGFDEERFFYVTKLDNGKFEVEGEGYICTDVDISVTLMSYLIRCVMETAYLKVNWQRLFYRQLRNMPKLQLSA